MNDLVFSNKNDRKLCDNVNNYRSVWPPKVEDRESKIHIIKKSIKNRQILKK